MLIIDEAQQSLATEAGKNTMFALKAARDAENQLGLPNQFDLVMTGSHRDKLAALIHDQHTPFFGAHVRDFPTLGSNYSTALTRRINTRLAPDAQLTAATVDAVFDDLGRVRKS